MIVTEAVAKTKWCVFARVNHSNDTENNGGQNMWKIGGNWHQVKCVGSDCMAWQDRGDGTGYCGLSTNPLKGLFASEDK